MLGGRPAAGAEQLAKVGFVAQDTPVYAGLSVDDHLRLGARLNPSWDDPLARGRIQRLGLDLTQKAGRLSGGQRAQLALTIAAAKRPQLLIFDEPVAALDPLARRAFLQDLMEFVAELDISVILSSHLLSDLERVCDHLIVLAASRVQLAGDVENFLAAHYRLIGARRDLDTLPADQSHPRRPHRPADHPDRPHRAPIHDPPGPRPPRPRRHRPGLHDPGRRQPRHPEPRWRRNDDLADLAPVPRRAHDRRRSRRAHGHPGLTGPGLPTATPTRSTQLHHRAHCSDFAARFFQDHGARTRRHLGRAGRRPSSGPSGARR